MKVMASDYVVYSMSSRTTRKLAAISDSVLLFDRYPRCSRTLVINKLKICDPACSEAAEASAKQQFAC